MRSTPTQSKLIAMFQQAHAGELAAYHAYEGHWRSVKDQDQKNRIREIQAEELDHLHQVNKMLHSLGGQPNVIKDLLYIIIGKTASIMCYITGWRLPMWGAMKIEHIGIVSYYQMEDEAANLGHFEMAMRLNAMGQAEAAHQNYFKKLLRDTVVFR